MRGHRRAGGRDRGGGGGRGGGGEGRGRGSQHHHQQQATAGGRRRRSRSPDAAEFERQLQLQRQRQEGQQQHDAGAGGATATPGAPSPPPDPQSSCPAPPALPGFQYDAARGRYFPAAHRARPTPSSSSSAPPAPARATTSHHNTTTPRGNNVAGRIREREWRRGRHLRMGAIGGLLHAGPPQMVGQTETLQDMDIVDEWIVTGGRNGVVRLISRPPALMHSQDLISCGSAVAAVRWRRSRSTAPAPEPPSVLAVAEMGSNTSHGVGGSAVTVCKLCDGGDNSFSLQVDRFSLGNRDVWGVEWDPQHGRRLLPGLSKGPLVVLDTEAGRQLAHPFHLASDCFASCWGRADSGTNHAVLLGLRNGQVRLVDLRAPSASRQPLTTMACVVDQVELLAGGWGVLVSDRLGGLQLLDLRAPFLAVQDFSPPTPTTTLAGTGFVLDPVDQTLCLMLTPQGVLRTFDLGGTGRSTVAGAVARAGATERFFLARRWDGSTAPGVLWSPLVCGNRATGAVLHIDPRRESGEMV